MDGRQRRRVGQVELASHMGLRAAGGMRPRYRLGGTIADHAGLVRFVRAPVPDGCTTAGAEDIRYRRRRVT